ncbi:hypothetical protein BKA56DRAFT_83245 [Ilyonectria sp. MPI-CAGE-AT-0026]|nr:hypothetical protein BKA56DRAFT_83245 [Ilyonectria sp. MPI-CAGE-AT-0026]
MAAHVKLQDGLCSDCRGVLLVKTADASKKTVIIKDQTFKVFREAVRNGCYIRSVVWHLSRQYRHRWSESPELWNPMQFSASVDSNGAFELRQIQGEA